MFRIECFCEDKKLASVLRTLLGQVIGTPNIVPVVNAQEQNGGVQAKSQGSVIDLFKDFMKDRDKEVRASLMREFCRNHGYSEKSYSYVMNKLKAANKIKRLKTKSGSLSKWSYTP